LKDQKNLHVLTDGNCSVRLSYVSINDDPRISVALLSSIQVDDRTNVALLGAEWVEHDEVAVEAPRSGLSRSDLVLWPFASFIAPRQFGRCWGRSGRDTKTIDLERLTLS
jgi:hypothetical protein